MGLNKKTLDFLEKGMFDSSTSYDDLSYVIYNMCWHNFTKEEILSKVLDRTNIKQETIECLINQKKYTLSNKTVKKNEEVKLDTTLTLDEYLNLMPDKARQYLDSCFEQSKNLERDVRYVAFCCASKKIPIDITKMLTVQSIDTKTDVRCLNFDISRIDLCEYVEIGYSDYAKKMELKEDQWKQRYTKK